MQKRVINFGIIGCGLMGREFGSAVARWCHLLDQDVMPRIVGVCDTNPAMLAWFSDNFESIQIATQDYHDLLNSDAVEAIYCAVPHNLHERLYVDIIEAGKHLLGEKPFGIDLAANERIMAAVQAHPEVLVRCSSEFPFYPGAQQLLRFIREERFGKIIEVQAGFLHSSDLDPNKPINWKRRVAINGEYGCMGDLGMHVFHIPLRAGWFPRNVRALLSNIVTERPGPDGRMEACETWDNAVLACEVQSETQHFPMLLETKRMAPGETNTWYLRILGYGIFGGVQHQISEDAAHDALHAWQGASLARAGPRLRVGLCRPSPALFLNWAYRTRFCRCGRLFAMNWPTPARCASPFIAPRRKRPRRAIVS